MSNNCLITKLKGVVNNDKLPRFRSLILHIEGGNQPKRYIEIAFSSTGEQNYAHVLGDKQYITRNSDHSTDLSSTLNLPTSTVVIYFANTNEDFDLEILYKDNISYLHMDSGDGSLTPYEMNTRDLYYMPNLTNFDGWGIPLHGSLEDIKNVMLKINLHHSYQFMVILKEILKF